MKADGTLGLADRAGWSMFGLYRGSAIFVASRRQLSGLSDHDVVMYSLGNVNLNCMVVWPGHPKLKVDAPEGDILDSWKDHLHHFEPFIVMDIAAGDHTSAWRRLSDLAEGVLSLGRGGRGAARGDVPALVRKAAIPGRPQAESLTIRRIHRMRRRVLAWHLHECERARQGLVRHWPPFCVAFPAFAVQEKHWRHAERFGFLYAAVEVER